MNLIRIFFVLALCSVMAFASSTILVLDASGTMDDPVSGTGGKTKIEIAKEAANTFLDNVRPGDEVSLIVFYDCSDIRTVVDFTTNMQSIKSQIADVAPDANTPIAAAITYADNYAATSGRSGASIIMLTDGDETCDSQDDAETAAANAVSSNIRVINVVGLGIDASSSAYSDLQKIASSGKGRYYSANDADQLTTSLTQAYGQSSCCVPMFLFPGILAAAFLCQRK